MRSQPNPSTALFRTNRIVSARRDADLNLIHSHKQGGFAVLPSTLFPEKAREAILNNLKAVPDVKLQKVKNEARKCCEELR
ncbi:hypothetical protein HPB48_021344 [Haemaphysalis longicornis]|uniref:Uncharacterized protein n=1 Tax=Haemaphysalis longicornis TaxID=44386 RepID=A0A9J6GJN2_HAELO|nr:hypothetical protein HPB48_021344 [Haemaphysalis longicornis]